MNGDEALRALRADLRRAFDTPKCRKCGCLRDTLEAVREEVGELAGDEAQQTRQDVEEFLAELPEPEYPCLGCDPCHPPEAQNRFHEAAAGVLTLREVETPTCGFEVRCDSSWPPVVGEYHVLDPQAAIAVSTLGSAGLAAALAAAAPPGLALVGKTETENIGLDKVVRNVVANPCLRFLILAGPESKGHLSGQTLLSLAGNGVDGDMRVIGSQAKRPHLRNVTAEEIAAFRQQVELVDLIGCTEVRRIVAEIERLAQLAPARCACAKCRSPAAAPIPSALTTSVRPTGEHETKLDPAGYLVILPQRDKGLIVVEHYDYQDRLQQIIEGEDARSICAAVVHRGLVSQLDHAAYLGRELMRAELSLRHGFPYQQDRA